MPERIGQHGDPAVGRIARGGLQDRAGALGALDCGVDIVDGVELSIHSAQPSSP